jgi:putative copper resistance protein D
VILLTETRFGRLWIVGRCAVLLFCTLWLGRPRALTVVAAILLMGSLAGSGHAAGSPGATGDMHLVADVLHLIAAGAWLGGLLPLVLLFGLATRQADPALASILPAATPVVPKGAQ